MLAISKSILKWWENGQYSNKRTYGFMSKTWFFSNTRYPKYPMILKINRVRIGYWKIFRVRVGYRVPVGPWQPQTQKGYFHITSTFSHLSLHYLNFEDWKEQRSTYLPCLETPSIQSLCYTILWVYIGKLFHTKMVTFLIYLGFNWPWKETNRKDTNTLKTHKWAIKSGEWVDSHFHNVQTSSQARKMR